MRVPRNARLPTLLGPTLLVCAGLGGFMTRFACALAGILFLAVADLRADNWPNWRGPDNNGVARVNGLPITWSESKNIAWKLPLPGKAGSTPVIWNDRIF